MATIREPLASGDDTTEAGGTAPAIIYMSGDRRGTTELLGEATRFIIREGRSGVRVDGPGKSLDPDVAAVLHRSGDTYELEVMPGREIWVNGAQVTARELQSGDVLEIGRNGPMLRYRRYAGGIIPRRSMNDVFADCFDGARFEPGPITRKTRILIGGFTEEFLLRTTIPFRIAVVLLLALLITSIVFLVRQNIELEERIARGEIEMLGLSTVIEQTESRAITRDDLLAMRGEIESELLTAVERVEALEARFGAAARIVSQASKSVIFLQGVYGFVHFDSGRPLRYPETESAAGQERPLQGGRPVTLDGDGPLVEIQFTGTGFVATDDGLLVTNRHVAQPWADKDFTAVTAAMGLVPTIGRFIGYLPGRPESLAVSLVSANDETDIAILRCSEIASTVRPILPSATAPKAGDEVIVLGYPTGVRAMLARTDRRFLDELRARGELDFWTVGEELARAGHIEPLATRGIVGQVTPSAVVYDAETTHGGSGGPVMTLDGKVVAVNSAILREFGGSNLGVPIGHAATLIEEITDSR